MPMHCSPWQANNSTPMHGPCHHKHKQTLHPDEDRTAGRCRKYTPDMSGSGSMATCRTSGYLAFETGCGGLVRRL
eukprot:7836951-Karenia_brevis.AAC.1